MAAQLAQHDAALTHMLGQLKRCSLRRRTPWQRLGAWGRWAWQRLRLAIGL
jgi:hypothetical protein